MIRAGLSHSMVSALVLLFAVEIKHTILIVIGHVQELLVSFSKDWAFTITDNMALGATIVLFFCWGVVFHALMNTGEQHA